MKLEYAIVVCASLGIWACSAEESDLSSEHEVTPEQVLSLELPDAEQASRAADLCQPFAEDLHPVPHMVLTMRIGDLESLWDQTPFNGCEVEFETNDSLSAGARVPSFDAIEGSEMHERGWRPLPGIGADGPGSGIFGIQKDEIACMVRWSQPAHIADDGEFVQSETLTMKIQCRKADK